MLKDPKKVKPKIIGSHYPNLNRYQKGGKGIHQYIKIDETKLSSEQRLGEKVELEKCSI